MAPVSKNNPSSGKSSTPRAPRREKRSATTKPSTSEIAAEAASIYPDTFDTPPSPEEIAAEAYAIYQARGGQHGRHQDDWLEAERRVAERKRTK